MRFKECIIEELQALDKDSIRPIRNILLHNESDMDLKKLRYCEEKANILRKQLKELDDGE